jgi:hypothetical protein
MLKNLVNGLTEDQLKLFISLAGGIALILGALITGVFGAMIARWNRVSAVKSEIRKIAIQSALENWRHQNILKIDLMKSGGRGNVSIESPDSYIIHMLRIINIAADMKLSPYEAANRIAQWSSGQIDSDGKPKPEDT